MIYMLIAGYKEQDMVSQTTKRSMNFVPSASTFAPEYSSCHVEVLVIDTTYHTGEDHSLIYDEIYKIFNTGDFPPEDEDLEAYINIQKSGIHLVVAQTTLFTYNKNPTGVLSGLTLALPQF
jgi:hypothetical protein